MAENKKTLELCKLTISSSPERGFEIFLQSEYDFNKLFAAKGDKTFNLGGVKCGIPRNGDGYQLQGVRGYFNTHSETFEYEGFLNLSLLLAKDIKNGVTFNFGVFPISQEKIQQYAENFKQQVKMIYLTYMKTIKYSVVFNTVTIEEEQHD